MPYRPIDFSVSYYRLAAGNQTVTHRLNWKDLKAGKKLAATCPYEPDIPIKVLSVRQVELLMITQEDVELEGLKNMTFGEFIDMFCALNNNCAPSTEVTRIEFEKI